MPRGRSLTSPETAQASGAFCANARINAGTWGNERCCVCFHRKAALHRRDQSSSACSTIHQLVAHQTKAPPPNKRKRLPPFWSIFIDYFSEYVPKLECRVSPSMVHIHPGAEWQEEDHQLPSQAAFKGFCRSLTACESQNVSRNAQVVEIHVETPCLWPG